MLIVGWSKDKDEENLRRLVLVRGRIMSKHIFSDNDDECLDVSDSSAGGRS